MTGEAGLPREPSPATAHPPLLVIMNMEAPYLALTHSVAGPCGRWLCAPYQPHCQSLEMSVAMSGLFSFVKLLPCRGDPAVGIFEDQKKPVHLDKY